MKDKTSTVFRNTLTNYMRYFVHIAVIVTILPVIIENLGKEAYGLWALVISVVGFFGFLDFGFSTSVVKYVARFRGERNREAASRFASTLQAVYWTIGLSVALTVFFLSPRFAGFAGIPRELREAAYWVLLCLGLRTAFNFPFSFYRGVLIGKQKMSHVNFFKISELLTNGAATWLLLTHGAGLKELAISTLVISVLHYAALACYTLLKHPEVRFSRSACTLSLLGEVTSFSFFAFLVNISVLIMTRTDIIVIKYLMPISAVAVYTVGLKLSDYTLGFSKQFVNALTPIVAELNGAKDSDAIRRVYLKGTKFSLLISQPIVLCLCWFTPVILKRWLGNGFGDAVPIARLLLLTTLITLTQASGANILAMTGRHRFLAGTTILSTLSNIVLSLVLGSLLGLPGVALATLTCAILVDAMLVLPAALKHTRLAAAGFFRKAIAPVLYPAAGLLCTLSALDANYTAGTIPAVAAHSAAAGLVYLLLAWHFSLSAHEKNNYSGKISRRLGSLGGSLRRASFAAPCEGARRR